MTPEDFWCFKNVSMNFNIRNLQLEKCCSLCKDFHDVTLKTNDNTVSLLFGDYISFRPIGMLMTMSVFRRFMQKNPNLSVEFLYDELNKNHTYAGTMGYFKSIDSNCEFGKEPGQAPGSGNYIPITKINIKDLMLNEILDQGNVIERESTRLAKIISRNNRNLLELFTYLLRETIRNVPEHSGTNDVWICGQYWPSKNSAEIAIIDEGIGVLASLSSNPYHKKYIDSDDKALKWALYPGISVSFGPSRKPKQMSEWDNSGFGLYVISEICKCLDGEFCIISGSKGYLVTQEGEKLFDTHFDGTALHIKISTQFNLNVKSMIQQICDEGENKAKTIRNTFAKASTPSKGLISFLDNR